MPHYMRMIQEDGNYVIEWRALVQRLNKRLQTLWPPRKLVYRKKALPGGGCYYLKTINPGQPDHHEKIGPVYLGHMLALADHINLWYKEERDRQPKVTWYKDHTVEPKPLPKELQFDVVTSVLRHAHMALRGQDIPVEELCSVLRSRGYIVQAPRQPDVTTEVTESGPED